MHAFLISPILRSHSPLLLSIHNRKQNSLRYPIPVLLLHHHTSAIITDCNRSTTLSPRLDLPGFWSGTETKREVWLLRTGFGIAPVNKLVSLTWLLWALRSFRSFTLHYITVLHVPRSSAFLLSVWISSPHNSLNINYQSWKPKQLPNNHFLVVTNNIQFLYDIYVFANHNYTCWYRLPGYV